MIPPAPNDFWDRVIKEVAQMVFSRETNGIVGSLPATTAVLSRKFSEDKHVSSA